MSLFKTRFLWNGKNKVTINSHEEGILGDPGAVSRVDKMFVVKVFCKFHHEPFIDPTNCPWVSEDVRNEALP